MTPLPIAILFAIISVTQSHPHPLSSSSSEIPESQPASSSWVDATVFPGFSITQAFSSPSVSVLSRSEVEPVLPLKNKEDSTAIQIEGQAEPLEKTPEEVAPLEKTPPEVVPLEKTSPETVSLESIPEAGMETNQTDKMKNQSPIFSPDPNSTYLFPYLFPGSGAYHPTLPPLPNLTLPLLPPIIQLPSLPGSGISRPLTQEEVQAVISSHLPWTIGNKDDMVKPIRAPAKKPVSKPVIVNQQQQQLPTHQVFGGTNRFNISSPGQGQLLVSFGNKNSTMTKEEDEMLRKELIEYFGDVLTVWDKLHDHEGHKKGHVENTSISNSSIANNTKDPAENVSIIAPPVLSSSTASLQSNATTPKKPSTVPKEKSKPSKQRPTYGIQSPSKDTAAQSPPRPIIATILNPWGTIPSIKWPSFTSLVHRLFGDRRGNNKEKPALRLGLPGQEADMADTVKAANCGVDAPNTQPICGSGRKERDACSRLCARNGFSGGICLEEVEKCVCYLDEGERFGERKKQLVNH